MTSAEVVINCPDDIYCQLGDCLCATRFRSLHGFFHSRNVIWIEPTTFSQVKCCRYWPLKSSPYLTQNVHHTQHRIAPVVAKNSGFPPTRQPKLVTGPTSGPVSWRDKKWISFSEQLLPIVMQLLHFRAYTDRAHTLMIHLSYASISQKKTCPPSTNSNKQHFHSLFHFKPTSIHMFPHFRHFHLYLEIWLCDLFDLSAMQSEALIAHAHTHTTPKDNQKRIRVITFGVNHLQDFQHF